MLFFVPHPLVSSLTAIENYLGISEGWQPLNDVQRKLIKGVYAEKTDLGFFRDRELKTYAGQSAAKLNEILRTEGFDIRLGELGQNGIGAVSVIKLMFLWISQGIRYPMNIGGKTYLAMKFDKGFSVLNSPFHDFPIARLEAMGGYEVFFTAQGDRRTIPNNGFVLYETIERIISSAQKASNDFESLRMPIIKVKTDIDISWMIGMRISKGKRSAVLEQAKEQLKLDVDEKGAKMEVASALGSRSYDFKIAEQFYVLVRKAGLKKGILYGLVDSNGWMEIPG